MKKLLTILTLFAASCGVWAQNHTEVTLEDNQTITGTKSFSQYALTVAGLPVAPPNGTPAIVLDGNGSSCTAGGGVTIVLCLYNNGWQVVSGGGGGGGSAFVGGLGNSFQDVTEVAAPVNPVTGNDRLWLDSTSHTLKCKTSSGADCFLPAAINLAGSSFGGVTGTLPGANMSAVNLAAGGNGGVSGILPTGNLPFTYTGNTTKLVTGGTIAGTAQPLCTDINLNATTSGCPGATSVPFSGITASTNSTAAMVIGTGASLAATGSGTITATSLALGSSGTITASSGASVDFSSVVATAFKIPVAVGASPTADGQLGVDSTTHYFNFGSNGSTHNVAAWAGDIGGNTALSPQVTVTHLSSPLPIAQGGTAGTTAGAAFTNLAPVATIAGSIMYWNGTSWVKLDGNTSGTNFLQENALGVPSWAATAATVAWSNISPAATNTIINNGAFSTTFTQTAAQNWFWSNTTASTSSVNQSSPIFNICGQGWEGSTPADTQDCWTLQNVIPNGPNPNVTLLFGNSGATSGLRIVQFPGPIATQGAVSTSCSGASGGCIGLTEGSSVPSGLGGVDELYAKSSSHRLMMNNNNAGEQQIVGSGVDINTSDQVISLHLTSPAQCTNQVLNGVTAGVTGTSTCVTITSAYVDTTVATTNGANSYTAGPQDLNLQALTQQFANDTVTGTTAKLLAKLTSTGAIKAGTSDTAVPVYIVDSGAGITGSAKLAFGGQELCTMDATQSNTEGFIVVASGTTAGECHAVSPPIAPTSGTFVIGTLKSNSTTLGSNATVAVNPYFVNPSSAGGGGSGTVNSATGGQMTGYTATGTTVSGLPSETFSAGDVTFGQAGSVQGSLSLAGATSSATKITAPATAGGTNTLQAVTDTFVYRATTDTLTNKTFDTGGTGNVFKANGTQGTTGQVLRATTSAGPQYIDFPDVHIIPAANCNNTTGGPGWSIGSGGTVTCRAGTNNKGGFISITDTSTTFATFQVAIPEDWDSASNPFIRFQVASTDATSGHTIIPSIQVACYKGDGSTTDDVAANAAHSLSTITLNTTANQFWSSDNVQMNATDMTGCVAGAVMQVTVGRATDTATNAEFYSATITFPRLLVVQAN